MEQRTRDQWPLIRDQWPLIVSVSIVAAGLWLVWHISRQPRVDQAAWLLLGGFVITATPLATVIKPLWGRWKHGPGHDGSPSLDLTDELADELVGQWQGEAENRQLLSPAPIAVRWRRSPRPVAGRVAEAVGTRSLPARFDPLPGLMPATKVDVRKGGRAALYEVYASVGSGRVLIIGSPGSGKTGAGILLLLDALKKHGKMGDAEWAMVPVPMMFTLTGWDPREQRLSDWLVARMRQTSDLSRGNHGPAAARLIASGQVAVILDGLDEISQELRPTVLAKLSEQATFRVVLLCRSEEMETAAATHHFFGAVALELQAVTAPAAADYLRGSQIKSLPEPWREFVDQVRRNPTSPVTQALDTPLMLTLVHDTYRHKDPRELLDTTRFRTRDDIEDYLLARVPPSAYDPRPGVKRPRYAQVAERALAYIAWRMKQDEARPRDSPGGESPTGHQPATGASLQASPSGSQSALRWESWMRLRPASLTGPWAGPLLPFCVPVAG